MFIIEQCTSPIVNNKQAYFYKLHSEIFYCGLAIFKEPMFFSKTTLC